MRTLISAVAATLMFTPLVISSNAGAEEEATFSSPSLTPTAALTVAQATLASCREQGFQVAVAIVDRGGNMQVMIRDQLAGPHTVETARRKAYTAVSFKSNTSQLAAVTQPGQPQSGTRDIPDILMLGGGIIMRNGDGALLGAVGVSGAPGGDLDDACAVEGIAAIEDDIAF